MRSLVVCAVEEGDDLGAVAGGVGTECGGTEAVGDAVLHSPQDGLVEEVGGFHIDEGGAGGDRLGTTSGAPEEGDYGGPVTDGVGAEVHAVGTGGDVLLHSPHNGLIEVVGGLYVNKKGIKNKFKFRTPDGPPEEGNDLAALTGIQGGKGSGTGAVGDAIVHGPHGGIQIIIRNGNIGERNTDGLKYIAVLVGIGFGGGSLVAINHCFSGNTKCVFVAVEFTGRI